MKAPAREYDIRLEKVYDGKMNKEIIILGSSRGADNILAGQIEKALGQSTYNLSYQGSDVTYQYFILKTLLRYNRQPKIIILMIDNPYEFDAEKSLVFRIDRLIPLAKYNYFNNELIEQNENTLISKFFFLGRLKRDQITFSQKKKTSVIPIDSFGSMPLFDKKKEFVLSFTQSKKELGRNKESKEKLMAFKKIQYLCNRRGIELIYAFSPSFMEFDADFYNRFIKEVDERQVVLYDSLNPIYKNRNYFYDESHLLDKGAVKYTNEIISFIQSKSFKK